MKPCLNCEKELKKMSQKFCSVDCRKQFKESSKSDDTKDSIDDPLEYIRKNHDGIIDFDAGLLLTFGYLTPDNPAKPSQIPITEVYTIPKTY